MSRKTLAEWRREKGLSQRQLAMATGVTRQAIGQYETGRRVPDIAKARLIAAALGVGVDDIVFPGELQATSPSSEGQPSREERAQEGGMAA